MTRILEIIVDTTCLALSILILAFTFAYIQYPEWGEETLCQATNALSLSSKACPSTIHLASDPRLRPLQ